MQIVCWRAAGTPSGVGRVFASCFTAEILGNGVVIKGVSRGCSFRITAHLLDALRGRAAFPQSDEPEPIKTAPRQEIELFVRSLIEPFNRALVGFSNLMAPTVHAL